MKKLVMLTVLFIVLVAGITQYSNGDFSLYVPPQTQQKSTSEPKSKPKPKSASEPKPTSNAEQTKAVWVATAYAIDYPSTPTTDAEALKQRCNQILDTAVKDGCNTIYLQVRPACDALYDSTLFPWSKYLTGHCDTAPNGNFDPLQYWTEQAHARNMKLHAWVNPYRICAGQNAKTDFDALPKTSPAKQHPEWVISCDGGYYFNPGIPEVRKLICDGVAEIVKQYDVDGIQFDDYFYPSTDFDDGKTFSTYGGKASLEDWRRDNVNQLIKSVHDVVHKQAKNPNCSFGVSPSGIWRNQSITVYNGSKTKGYEHYSSAYADSLTWIQNGWIDYICPQIYWEIGHDAADFDTLTHWWAEQVHDTNVNLIIGLAAYRINDGTSNKVWQSDGVGEIGRQIDLINTVSDTDGYAIFSYRNLETVDGLSNVLMKK